ncbi:MAG: hypothetical protein KGM44_08630, partial [bacterium]|nr:hypothetical protein [bacterium]
ASESSSSTMPSCKASDPVVWVNTSSKVYHLSGDKYYGKTKHGKYECQSAANAEGDRMAKSGAVKSKEASTSSGTSTSSTESTSKKHHRKPKASPEPSASP